MQHRHDNGQGVQVNEEIDKGNIISLYKEKRNVIHSAVFASAFARCLLIVFILWLVAVQRQASVKLQLRFF